MKKIFGLLLALTLCFVFVGCKEKKNPVEEEIKELTTYCLHDVRMTYKVFEEVYYIIIEI